MELGNMVFGNSRGEFNITGDERMEAELLRLFDAISFTGEGNCYGEDFENTIFSAFRYYWGECSCGFDNYEFKEDHLTNCYQGELLKEELAAGFVKSEFGFLEHPSKNYDTTSKIKNKIYEKLTKKHGLSMLGCAVHCTCDYSKRYEEWLKKIGYPNGDKEDCLLLKPNFHFKPTDYRIKWYKYYLRDSYANKKLSIAEFRQIINQCIKSLGDDMKQYIGSGWEKKFETGGSVINCKINKDELMKLPVNEWGDIELTIGDRKTPNEKSKATHTVYIRKD